MFSVKKCLLQENYLFAKFLAKFYQNSFVNENNFEFLQRIVN